MDNTVIIGGTTTTPLSVDAINEKIVDQDYNPESEHAQSGKAVAEALAQFTPSIDEEQLVGEKTDKGGEIFNDYENNKALALHTHAEGAEVIAGTTAFAVYTTKYDSTNKRYCYILNTVEGLEVGDVYSLRSGKTYINNGTITEIVVSASYSGRYDVYVDTFASLGDSNSYLFIVDKPLCGDTPFELAEHSEGYQTQSVLLGAHAEGCYSKALGRGSHAEGIETIAEHAAHSEGQRTYAKGVFSHAEGYETVAELDAAHAEGNKTKATGQYSHAEGSGTKATAAASHSEGTGTESSQMAAHAEGDTTKALGHASHTEGVNTQAIGHSSHAEGYETKATEQSSHSEGHATIASGVASHAEGIEGTKASGQASHAEGRFTKAEGNYSHSEGNKTEAKHTSSHTSGTWTISGRESQTVVGKYNEIDADALFVVGNGTSDTNRSNAFCVYEDNSVKIGKTKLTEEQIKGLLALLK